MFSVWVHPWPFKHILEISLANRKSRSEPLTATSSPLREDRDSDLKVTVGASPTPVPISLLLLMTATPRGLDATNRPVSATSLGAGGCRRKEGHLPCSVASARHRRPPWEPRPLAALPRLGPGPLLESAHTRERPSSSSATDTRLTLSHLPDVRGVCVSRFLLARVRLSNPNTVFSR